MKLLGNEVVTQQEFDSYLIRDFFPLRDSLEARNIASQQTNDRLSKQLQILKWLAGISSAISIAAIILSLSVLL